MGAAILLVATAAHAQTASRDPIDAALDGCLDAKAALTTAGSLDCIGNAAAAWDKRLNKAYGDLMKTLDPPSHNLLLTAQRAWLDYRRKDETFASGPWRDNSGTLAQVTIASSRLDELKARVRALETYGRGD